MAEPNLKIILTAVDNASKSLKDVTSNVKGTESSFAGLGNTLKGLGITFGVAATAMGAWNLAKGAAEAQVVAGAFNRMAGSAGMASDALVAAMKRATAGTIEGTDLMQMANDAMARGVIKNQTDIVTVLELSRLKGQQFGMSTEATYGNIISAMASGNERYLKQLGMLADTTQAQKVYADSVGKAVGELTDMERQQAAVNAILAEATKQLKETGGAVNTTADDFARLGVKAAEAKESIGAALLKTVVGYYELINPAHAVQREWDTFVTQQRLLSTSAQQAAQDIQLSYEGLARVQGAEAQALAIWLRPGQTEMGRLLAMADDIDILTVALDRGSLVVKDSYNAWEQWAQLTDTMATGPMLRTWADTWREIIGEAELMPIQLQLVGVAEDEAVRLMKEFAKATHIAKVEVEATATAMMTLAQFESQLTSPGVIAEGAGPGGMSRILDLMAQGASAVDAAAQVNAMIRGAARAGLNPPKEYATGGVVGGPAGAPQLAVVHGGETVTPAGGMMVNIYLDGRFIGTHLGQQAVRAEQVRSS